MRDRSQQHDVLYSLGHAFPECIAAGKHLQGQQHEYDQHAELGHAARHGRQINAKGGCGKSVRPAPIKNKVTEPPTGTCINHCTTKIIEAAAETRTTSPMANTLETMISMGVTGMTSKCSMVPCSRSRMRAAPVRMIEIMVIWLITWNKGAEPGLGQILAETEPQGKCTCVSSDPR